MEDEEQDQTLDHVGPQHPGDRHDDELLRRPVPQGLTQGARKAGRAGEIFHLLCLGLHGVF